MARLPKQRVSFAEKSKNDYEWAKTTMQAIITDTLSSDEDYYRKLSNYRLYNNVLDQRDYEKECNPLGLNVGQFKDAVQPYNKTYNKIQALLGDELSRKFPYKAVLINSEGVRSKLLQRDAMIKQYVLTKIQNIVSTSGVPKEITDSIISEEDIKNVMSNKFQDAREITANKILKYVYRTLSLRDKKNDAFKHGLISGEEIIYVGEVNGLPVVEIINPLSCFYHKSPETKYIQDGLYAGCKTYMTAAEILDKYGEFMSEKDRNAMDENAVSPYRYTTYDYFPDGTRKYSNEGSYNSASSINDILVQHVEWRSQRKVGFLRFVNEYGDIQEDVVSEDFGLPEGYETRTLTKEFGRKVTEYTYFENEKEYTLTWNWIPEIWTGTVIGSDIYVLVGPKADQYRSMDDPYSVNLGYHGLSFSSMNAPSVSLMDRMKPFQYLYFIIMHKMKKLIAQDQGKVLHFDMSMVDPTIGWEKTMYYIKEMNIDIFNPLMNADQPGSFQRGGKVASASDLSTMSNIMGYINLLASIDQQISDVAGVNRQREGQISPTEAVSNSQANIQMSAVITEVYFQAHYKLWQQVLNSLLKTARRCFKKRPILKQYVLDDLSIASLELSTADIDDSELGVYISDTMEDEQVFEALQSMGDALVRANKASLLDLVKFYKATSTEELESAIENTERKFDENQRAAMEAEQQHEASLQQAQQAYELEKQARDHAAKIKIAEIQSFSFQKDQDSDDDGVPDQFEIEKFKTETALKSRALDIQEKKANAAIRKQNSPNK